MMFGIKKQRQKIWRQKRVRAKIKDTAERPRVSVFRSNRYLWLQVIDDVAGRTIAAASEKEVARAKKGGRRASAEKTGALLAARAIEKKVARVAFDRGPYRYHGLVRAAAEGARKGGLKF